MGILRLATADDCYDVNRLAQQLSNFHEQWWGVALSYDRYPAEEFQNIIDSEQLYVAQCENKIIGYMYTFISSCFGPGDEEYAVANIVDFCVDEEFRDRGFGKQMMQEYLEYAKLKDCKKVNLDVVKDNIRALSLYQQFGFGVVGYHMELNL